MEIKIFKSGFTEAEFNDFIKYHIVYDKSCLPDGTVYLFFKNLNKIGSEPVQLVERVDGMVTKLQLDTLSNQIESENLSAQIADLKEKIGKFGPNQKEYKDLETTINGMETQIKMLAETAVFNNRKIDNSKLVVQEIINALPASINVDPISNPV